MVTFLENSFLKINLIGFIYWCLIGGQLLAQETPAYNSFDSDGVQIHYLDMGKGMPVIFLHGLASSAESWMQIGMLQSVNKAGFRTIALDSRGHGRSDKPYDSKKYGAAEVEDILRLLKHLNISKAHFVGYSRGSELAIGFLTLYPNYVQSLVLGGFGYDGETSGLVEQLQNDEVVNALATGDILPLLRVMTPPDTPLPSPEQTNTIRQNLLGENDIKALAASMKGTSSIKRLTVDELKSNNIPILAVVGDDDWLFRALVDKMVSLSGNFEAIIIPNANHMFAFNRPEFKTASLGFILKNSKK